MSRQEVLAAFGDIEDLKVARIIATGATRQEIERVAAWRNGESDVMGQARDVLGGREAVVFGIIISGSEEEDGDGSRTSLDSLASR